MSFDLALLSNATITDSSGTVTECQTLMFRPVGSIQVIAQRTRNISDARATSWSVGKVDLASLDPKFRMTSGKFDGIDPAMVMGFEPKSAKGEALGFVTYRTNPVEPVVRDASTVTAINQIGYLSFSHSEIAEIHSSGKIAGNAAQRVSKCLGTTPRGGNLPDVPKTQGVAAWLGQDAAFNYSRWAQGVFGSAPRGEYTFAAYDGTSVAAAAGEKVVVEKRLFDKVFTRPNGDAYYGRKIGDHEDVDVLTSAREHGENVLLFGPPGTGKTALVEAAYHDVVTILGTAETEVADFVGSYTQRPGEGFVWVDGPLIEAMEGGKALLVDEIGLVDPKVLSILYSVMDGRGALKVTQNPDRGTVHAKDGFYVIAATNPHAPGVQLSEALISRFTIQVEVDSDYELALHLKVSRKIVSAAQNMDRRRRTGDMLWAPQLRELFAFKRNEAIFGTSFAARSLVAGAPEIDRDTVADIIGKALKDTITPLRMEG